MMMPGEMRYGEIITLYQPRKLTVTMRRTEAQGFVKAVPNQEQYTWGPFTKDVADAVIKALAGQPGVLCITVEEIDSDTDPQVVGLGEAIQWPPH